VHYEIPANAMILLHEIHSEIGPNHPIDHLSFLKCRSTEQDGQQPRRHDEERP
jgi:hypothetical protein